MLLVLYFCGFIFALMAEKQYGASCKYGAFFSSITPFLHSSSFTLGSQDSTVDMATP